MVPAGKEIYIEIKCGPEILPALKRDLAKAKLDSAQVAIISFGHNVIAAARKELPELRAFHIVGFSHKKETGELQPPLAGVVEGLTAAHASGLDAGGPVDFFTPQTVRTVRNAGFEFHCWTINDEPTARLMQQLGVDSITTNRPVALRRWLFSDKTDRTELPAGRFSIHLGQQQFEITAPLAGGQIQFASQGSQARPGMVQSRLVAGGLQFGERADPIHFVQGRFDLLPLLSDQPSTAPLADLGHRAKAKGDQQFLKVAALPGRQAQCRVRSRGGSWSCCRFSHPCR